jgi:hypothetical protein
MTSSENWFGKELSNKFLQCSLIVPETSSKYAGNPKKLNSDVQTKI